MIKTFLTSTVLITFEVRPGESSFGTGFFLFRAFNGNKYQVFLITNKHVLPLEGVQKNISIRVAVEKIGKTEVKDIDIPIVGNDGIFLPTVRLHPNSEYDVAGVNITDTVAKHGIQGTWLPMNLLATDICLRSENINVGDEVFLLGYPNAIYDPRNQYPILRTGVIATVPTEGYAFNDALKKQFKLPDRIDGFLIDANVFPGSSGSVVILKPQSTTIGPQGQTVVGRKKKIPYVLGIVSGSIPINDTVLRSTQRMGLGIVYSAKTIRAVVDQFSIL